MRSVELAKVAAAAEALRLRRFTNRQVHRAIHAVVAIVFALAAFAMLHVLAFLLLESVVRPSFAALILLVIDAVVAGAYGSWAIYSRPDRVEQEALEIRRRSLGEAKRALTFMAMAGQVAGFVLGRGTRRALRGSRLAQFGVVADLASRFIRRR